MKKFLYIAVAIVVACSFALTSMKVSAARHVDASTTPPKLKKGVTISIVDYFPNAKNDPERALMSTVANAWAKKTGNHVNLLGDPGNNNGKWCVQAPAKQAADIFEGPHDQIPPLIDCKGIASVPTWALPASLQKQYTSQALKAIFVGGKPYSIPFAAETTGIYWNKALLSSYPKPLKGNKYVTWQQIIDAAKPLTGSGKFGFLMPLNDLYFDYQFLAAKGGYVFKYNSKKRAYDSSNIGLDNAGAIAGMQYIKDMSTNGKNALMPPTTSGDVMKGLFLAGRSAMMLDGPWIGVDLKGANISYGFAPSPSFDGKHLSHPFGGIQTFAVNAFSSNKNEAFALAQYLSLNLEKPELQAKNRVPVLKSLLKSKAVQGDAYFKALDFATATQMTPMPSNSDLTHVWTPVADALDNVVKNKSTPADAAHAAVTKIKADIAKAHGG